MIGHISFLKEILVRKPRKKIFTCFLREGRLFSPFFMFILKILFCNPRNVCKSAVRLRVPLNIRLGQKTRLHKSGFCPNDLAQGADARITVFLSLCTLKQMCPSVCEDLEASDLQCHYWFFSSSSKLARLYKNIFFLISP